MIDIYVQFSDSNEDAIVAVFSCPQDQGAHPNQATIGSNDPRYAAWYAALPQITKWSGAFVAPGA